MKPMSVDVLRELVALLPATISVVEKCDPGLARQLEEQLKEGRLAIVPPSGPPAAPPEAGTRIG